MLSKTVFSNANIKPSRLHISTPNMAAPMLWAMLLAMAKRANRARFDSRAPLPKLGSVTVDKPVLMASYQVAFMVAVQKPHTIAEELMH